MTSYLQSTRDFLSRRKRPFIILGTLAGGVYMAANYAVSKLSEMQRRMVEERRDRENLRRRFQQNQEDCNYTTLALLPTLGDQLFAYMDVEGLTSRLQKGRLSNTGTESPVERRPDLSSQVQANDGGGNDTSSLRVADGDLGSLNGAQSTDAARPAQQMPADQNAAESAMEDIWNKLQTKEGVTGETEDAHILRADGTEAKEVNAPKETAVPEAVSDHAPSSSGLDAVAEPAPKPIPPEARLTPSPAPSPAAPDVVEVQPPSFTGGGDGAESTQDPQRSTNVVGEGGQIESSSPSTTHATIASATAEEKQAKLHLWNELKVAAISRTVTSLYAVVLLSLQSHVQVNLLGRYAYLMSVSSLSVNEEESSSSSPSSQSHQIRIERHDRSSLDDADEYEREEEGYERSSDEPAPLTKDSPKRDIVRDGIDVQTERLYLTLSWWFLHEGWRTLADIVQGAVHDVFDDVALKSTLTHEQFTSMLRKVRRRIEYESGVKDGNGDVPLFSERYPVHSDARSELSAATTHTTNFARTRGKRRNFVELLFPPTDKEVQVLVDAGALSADQAPPRTANGNASPLAILSPILPGLLDETRDIIESDDFWRVMRLGLKNVFDVFEDSLRPSFGLGFAPKDVAPLAAQVPSIVELPNEEDVADVGKKVRLASLFPAIARQSTAVIHSSPNEYVDSLASLRELRAFSAVIYSAWS